MSQSNVVHLHKKNPLPFIVPAPKCGPIPLEDVVQILPELLETAISYLLDDFDYEANIKSDRAVGIRLLAVGAERLTSALEKVND